MSETAAAEGGGGPNKPVKKAKSAFLYYQGDMLSKIRTELGPTASMGDAMTEVSLESVYIAGESVCVSCVWQCCSSTLLYVYSVRFLVRLRTLTSFVLL
jgi:hypothetical protein